MFRGFKRLLQRDWLSSVIVITSIVGGGLQHGKLSLAAHVLVIIVVSGLALFPLATTWQNLRGGINKIDILLPITLMSALITRHFWIGMALLAGSYITTYVLSAIRRRGRRSIERRTHVIPEIVSVIRGRKVLKSAVSEVHIGDKIVCQPDELVAFDSQVVSGETTCDESLLGGDGELVAKRPADLILSGSRNVGQTVTLKVQRLAIDSYYQNTTQLLQKSVGDQTTFVQTSDRYGLYVTISALIIAVAAWYLGHDANRFLAVLVVATTAPVLVPPRLALGTAIMTACRRGIIIRSGTVMQKLATATNFAFSFHGVITEDKPIVETVMALKPYTKNEVLGMAASLEQAVTHPLANAVVAAAEAQGFNFIRAKHVQFLPNLGLKANLQGQELLIGNARLMTEYGVRLPVKVNAKLLTIYVATAGQLAGTISFRDKTHSSVAAAFATLRTSGVEQLHIISGAPQPVIEASSQPVGSVTVHADATLAEKLSTLAAIGRRPVFVGRADDDSLLAVADLGIVLGDVSSRANHGAGIGIIHGDIAYVALARTLVQRAFRRAKQAIVIGTVASLALMMVALSGRLPLLAGVGLQLIINCFVTVYPLVVDSHKV